MLFAEHGFVGASVPDIARASGVSTGALYRHFADKGAMVNALFRRWKRVLVGHLLDDLPLSRPPRQQIGHLWRRLASFERLAPHAFDFLELRNHSSYMDDQSRAFEAEQLMPVMRMVEAAAAIGVLRAAQPEALIAMVWGAFTGLVKAERMGYLQLTDTLLEATEAAIWAAVKNPTTTGE